jgi:hypothetical protein
VNATIKNINMVIGAPKAKFAALTVFGYTNLENTTTRSKSCFT